MYVNITYRRVEVSNKASKVDGIHRNIALHVSDAFCVHLQEHLETVEAASGE